VNTFDVIAAKRVTVECPQNSEKAETRITPWTGFAACIENTPVWGRGYSAPTVSQVVVLLSVLSVIGLQDESSQAA
jgi:hypothetical protein